MNILILKGTVHGKDRHCKPLDTLTARNNDYRAKEIRNRKRKI